MARFVIEIIEEKELKKKSKDIKKSDLNTILIQKKFSLRMKKIIYPITLIMPISHSINMLNLLKKVIPKELKKQKFLNR